MGNKRGLQRNERWFWLRDYPRLLPAYVANRWQRGLRISGPPCFIVGCGHSGTSILLAIMGAHSRVHAVPYESYLGFRDDMDRLLRRFDFMAIAHGKTRWVEKTPKNIYCIPRLLACRPDARVIVLIRDGRDVAASIKIRYGSLEKGIERWIADNEAGEPFWADQRVLRIRYEDLIEAFEPTMRRTMEFIGEEYEPGMRDYHREKKRFYSNTVAHPAQIRGRHRQYRNWQINQPLFDGRGKRKMLSDTELALVKERLGGMLVRYGYPVEG